MKWPTFIWKYGRISRKTNLHMTIYKNLCKNVLLDQRNKYHVTQKIQLLMLIGLCHLQDQNYYWWHSTFITFITIMFMFDTHDRECLLFHYIVLHETGIPTTDVYDTSVNSYRTTLQKCVVFRFICRAFSLHSL